MKIFKFAKTNPTFMHLRLLYLLAAAAAVLFSSAQSVSTRYIQPIDPIIPDEGSTVWDFTGAMPDGPEIDVKVWLYGDSLMRVDMPYRRYDFALRSDTIVSLRNESRFLIMEDSVGRIEAVPRRDAVVSFPFFQRGQAFQRDSIFSEGEVILYPRISGTAVFAMGDTIRNVSLHRNHSVERIRVKSSDDIAQDDSAHYILKKDIFTWMLPDDNFPLARTEVEYHMSDSSLVSREVIAWRISETGDIAETSMKVRRNSSQPGSGRTTEEGGVTANRRADLDMIARRLEISDSGDYITVTSDASREGDSDAASRNIRMIFTDILGRVLAYAEPQGNAVWRIPKGNIPSGEYLLNISDSVDSVTRKILLH